MSASADAFSVQSSCIMVFAIRIFQSGPFSMSNDNSGIPAHSSLVNSMQKFSHLQIRDPILPKNQTHLCMLLRAINIDLILFAKHTLTFLPFMNDMRQMPSVLSANDNYCCTGVKFIPSPFFPSSSYRRSALHKNHLYSYYAYVLNKTYYLSEKNVYLCILCQSIALNMAICFFFFCLGTVQTTHTCLGRSRAQIQKIKHWQK